MSQIDAFDRWIIQQDARAEEIAEGMKVAIVSAIQEIMLERGLNRAQLARRMGVSPENVGWIIHHRNITIQTIARAAAALDAEVTITFKLRRVLP